MSPQQDSLYQALVALERSFDLGHGFLAHLYKRESDWSFVIKAHALLEAATTQLLASHLGDPELAKIFANVPHADTRFGRVEFLEHLRLLDDGQLRFLRKFSELRNQLVHNVHNARFTFIDHVATLSDPSKEFAKWVVFGSDSEAVASKRQQSALANPRLELWLAVITIVASCELARDRAKERQATIRKALERLEAAEQDEFDQGDEDDLDDEEE